MPLILLCIELLQVLAKLPRASMGWLEVGLSVSTSCMCMLIKRDCFCTRKLTSIVRAFKGANKCKGQH